MAKKDEQVSPQKAERLVTESDLMRYSKPFCAQCGQLNRYITREHFKYCWGYQQKKHLNKGVGLNNVDGEHQQKGENREQTVQEDDQEQSRENS